MKLFQNNFKWTKHLTSYLQFKHNSSYKVTEHFLLDKKVQNKILQETCVSCDHLTPELKLHLITPSCRLWNVTPEESPFYDPYWGFYWPGGQALSRYILDNPSIVKDKVILDFGCGCGATGLAGIVNGARTVIFNDIDKVALNAAMLNGILNNLTPSKFTNNNLISTDCDDVDVVFVGDLLYDDYFGDSVLNWIYKLHKRGKSILIGDPERFVLQEHLLKDLLHCVGEYNLLSNTILENKGHSKANVWMFKSSNV